MVVPIASVRVVPDTSPEAILLSLLKRHSLSSRPARGGEALEVSEGSTPPPALGRRIASWCGGDEQLAVCGQLVAGRGVLLLKVFRAVLPLVLFLAAVPAASASPTGGEIPHCKPLWSDELPPSDREAQAQDLELSVRYTWETALPAGQHVRWILSLRNRTSLALHLSFRSTQYANVMLLRGGRIVYSWDAKYGFGQSLTARRLGPRETYVCRLGPDLLDLEPGRYELVAYLNSMTRVQRVNIRRSFVVPGWRDLWRLR